MFVDGATGLCSLMIEDNTMPNPGIICVEYLGTMCMCAMCMLYGVSHIGMLL